MSRGGNVRGRPYHRSRMTDDGRTVIARDGCAVPTGPLTELLGSFVTSWNVRHPQTAGQFAPDGARKDDCLRALDYLEQETGIGPGTLRNIIKGRYHTTELRVADRIVSVLGCVEVFHDGTLPIIPNPSASREARAQCCSGCSTGVPAATNGTGDPGALTGSF